eukprot:TRINITY_DN3520_c0_g1_i1.p1 TRINITY_DN3520_c0_g1~~TRINITY_DN3520_c0_g1_i1.p1  ORF type:complete len:286 (+),score=41.25 TRINITY_DN3520_c0_g1_i1:593-1450(+)
MGAESESNSTIKHIKDRVLGSPGEYNFLLHNGDISYADGFQRQWDIFGRKVQEISANLPYMVTPGNHELPYEFGTFRQRFAMPQQISRSFTNLYWSFNYGLVHVIGTDTESEIDTPMLPMNETELEWLEKDLAAISQQRDRYPWVIVMNHRPFYCSGHGGMGPGPHPDCNYWAEYLRQYFEPLFHKYKVDLVMQAHVHNYERSYPVYQGKVTSKSYDNPSAPVYVVNGAAGCREGLASFSPPPPFSAVQLKMFGFAELEITPQSLHYSFIADSAGKVADSFTITK